MELAIGLGFYVVFLLSTTLHEAAHSWAALLGGDDTAYRGGQVSIDPLPHIRREPIGMVVLPLISIVFIHWPFGFASAPYDPEWASRFPRRAAWMSLAGPVANLLLVITSAIAMRAGYAAGWFEAPESLGLSSVVTADGGMARVLAMLFSMFFSLNLILCLLNLLPLPPLDGSGVVPAFLGEEAARKYSRLIETPMLAWVGILIAWQVMDLIFFPIFVGAANVMYFPAESYGPS